MAADGLRQAESQVADADEIMRRARLEAARRRSSPPPPAPDGAARPAPASAAPPPARPAPVALDRRPPDLAFLEARAQAAAEVAPVGAAVPPMHRQRGLKRLLATAVARVFLRIAQLFTRDQRTFNQAIVDAVRELARLLAEQHRLVGGDLSSLASSLGAQEDARLALGLELAARVAAGVDDSARALQALDGKVQAELGAHRARLEGLSAQLWARQQPLQAEVAELREQLVQRVGALERRLAEEREQLDLARRSALEAAEQHAARVGQELGALRSAADAASAERRELAARVGAVAAQVEALPGRLAEAVARLEGLAGREEESRRQLGELSARLDDWSAQLDRSLQERLGELSVRVQALQARDEEGARALGAQVNEVSQRLAEAGERAGRALAAADELARALPGRLQELRGQLEKAAWQDRQRVAQLQIAQALHDRRIATLLEAARRTPPPAVTGGASAALPAALPAKLVDTELAHLNDTLYADFEDTFRGPRRDIQERARGYLLPLVRESGAGAPDRPILDLGCGRGEWLELARQEGLAARGVDSNRSLVQQCRDLGLDVTEADGLEFLRGLPDASLGALTAIHVLEHLPFEAILAIFDQAARLLKPGGIAVFETPNCTNLGVGARDFYRDPTHRNPLHPESMQFLLERRGLVRVAWKPLHPVEAELRLPDDGSVAARWLNDNVFGARDYAVLGYRA